MEPVLIITYYWPPSGGSGVQRPLKFAKYLPELGYKPIILTSANPTFAQLDESLRDEIPEECEVFTVKGFEPYGIYGKLSGKSSKSAANQTSSFKEGGSLVSKIAAWIRGNVFIPDARIGWSLSAKSKALQLVDELGIKNVITTGPPQSLHLIGLHLKKERPSINWIADFRDPWTFVFYNEVFQKTALSKAIDQNLEKKVLKSADEVIVVAPGMKIRYEEIYSRDYDVISNGFDHSDLPSKKASENKVFTIRYTGLLAESYNIDDLFSVLQKLKEQMDFKFEFIGQVHQKVHQYIHKFDLQDQINLRDYIPHEEILKEMQSADLLLLMIPSSKKHPYILTGKLFEYMASGTPILHMGFKEGDAAKVINEQNAGMTFSPEEHTEILNFIQNLSQGEYTQSGAVIDKMHPYSRYSLTKQLTGLFNK